MLLALNWKMNPQTLSEAKSIFLATKKASARAGKVQAIVAPPAFFLNSLSNSYKGRSISFAVQDIHAEMSGAFTGGVSAPQAKSAGAQYAIVGHAERRKAGDTDEDVRAKVRSAIAAGLGAIICIGENERDHSGTYLEVLKQQVSLALTDVNKTDLKRIVIAYEPVWAIGAEKPMPAREMHEMTIFIRKLLQEKYEKSARSVLILYGGSMLDAEHAVHIAKESEIDGFLLGRASIDPKKLEELFRALAKL